MRWLFSFVVLVHGLIHLMGFCKAFGLAELPQLTQPISRPMGLVWLGAAALVMASVVAFFVWPRGWWVIGAAALVVSEIVVVTAWRDAKFGTVANVILLLGVAYGYLTQGPSSFRAAFERDVEVGLARPLQANVVTEADLAFLPDPVQRYLRATGVVGQPRVRNYRLRFRGRIRGAPDAAWMPFEADQQSFVDEQGLLENFISEDRSRSSPDGKTFTQLRFSTPVGDYRSFGPFKISARGEARWHPPEGEFAYGEFELVELHYNVR